MNNNTDFSDHDAAYAYAKAWNRLDPSDFLARVAQDVTYTSQWVCEELKGKTAFSEYFEGKIETIKASDSNIIADIGITSKSWPGRACALISQDLKNAPDVAVLFKTINGKIIQIDMCMPELLAPIAQKQYPK